VEFLRNFFSSLSSGVIRLAVAVGILAAVGFFIVKPILHTTENTVNSANKAFEKSFNEAPTVNVKGIEEKVDKTIEDVNRQVQTQVKQSFHTAKVHGHPKKLLHCVQHANGNVHRIERCTRRY
jgi:predicted PurR-regulated permease PerM